MRVIEERIDELVYGYREDLGIGRPVRAPKNWPVSQRTFTTGLTLAQSEEALRAHIPIKDHAEVIRWVILLGLR